MRGNELNARILFLSLLSLWLSTTPLAAQEGEWIDLEPLRNPDKGAVAKPAAMPVRAETAPEPGLDPAAGEAAMDAVLDDGGENEQESPPPLDLPRRFRWQGREAPLGRVGWVYLGDFYFVEERDFVKAETCWLHALKPWPECGPIQTRLELLSLFTGDWLHSAESMQVSFDDGAPPRVTHDYGIDAKSPILSNRRDEVPPVPAIHFRLALAKARQIETEPVYEAARDFLVGRLLAHLGETEEAIRVLGPVALDPLAEPWNFQAASQRAALLLENWEPELAYVNLLRAKELVGEHPVLMDRLESLRAEMTLQIQAGEGRLAQAVVRILGSPAQGRWILSAPDVDFAGRVEVAKVADGSEETPPKLQPHLLYRGRDYWVMTVPLGSSAPEWREGVKVTLRGNDRG